MTVTAFWLAWGFVQKALGIALLLRGFVFAAFVFQAILDGQGAKAASHQRRMNRFDGHAAQLVLIFAGISLVGLFPTTCLSLSRLSAVFPEVGNRVEWLQFAFSGQLRRLMVLFSTAWLLSFVCVAVMAVVILLVAAFSMLLIERNTAQEAAQMALAATALWLQPMWSGFMKTFHRFPAAFAFAYGPKVALAHWLLLAAVSLPAAQLAELAAE